MTSVDALADRLAIVDLLHRYATGLDTKDWDLLASGFTADGVADYGALGGLDASQHIITNEVIELDGDRATARCYFQAQHVFTGAEGGDNFLVGGTYDDEIVRTVDGWRIRHRTLTATWTDGNPAVFEAAAARLAAGHED